jgi:hypothetical protein
VAFRLVHHDLITVPLGHRRPGIFWLRLYDGDATHVAVVTEVPGNPSSSVTNAISQIAYYIESRFQLNAERLALIGCGSAEENDVVVGGWGVFE